MTAIAVPSAMHVLDIRKFKRDDEQVLIRSALAEIHSYFSRYDQNSRAKKDLQKIKTRKR